MEIPESIKKGFDSALNALSVRGFEIEWDIKTVLFATGGISLIIALLSFTFGDGGGWLIAGLITTVCAIVYYFLFRHSSDDASIPEAVAEEKGKKTDDKGRGKWYNHYLFACFGIPVAIGLGGAVVLVAIKALGGYLKDPNNWYDAAGSFLGIIKIILIIAFILVILRIVSVWFTPVPKKEEKKK